MRAQMEEDGLLSLFTTNNFVNLLGLVKYGKKAQGSVRVQPSSMEWWVGGSIPAVTESPAAVGPAAAWQTGSW